MGKKRKIYGWYHLGVIVNGKLGNVSICSKSSTKAIREVVCYYRKIIKQECEIKSIC
jgi:hypothetical protein